MVDFFLLSFAPLVQGLGVGPQKQNVIQFQNINVPQGRFLCAISMEF